MNSSVPYIIRAMNEWMLDNNCTPYLVLDVTVEGVSVPMEYVKDGQIVLNIGPMAIRDLLIDNDGVSFSGRFGGVAHEIYAPIEAVLGIVTRENGEGMWFPRDADDPEPPETPDPGPSSGDGPPKKGPPNLKVIK